MNSAEKFPRPAVVCVDFRVFIILSSSGCVLGTSRCPNSVRVCLASVVRDLFVGCALTAEVGLDCNYSLRPMSPLVGRNREGFRGISAAVTGRWRAGLRGTGRSGGGSALAP